MSGDRDQAIDPGEAIRSLRKDLEPGPFQPISGWAHAMPKGKRDAILAVCAEVARLNEWINTHAYDRNGFKI